MIYYHNFFFAQRKKKLNLLRAEVVVDIIITLRRNVISWKKKNARVKKEKELSLPRAWERAPGGIGARLKNFKIYLFRQPVKEAYCRMFFLINGCLILVYSRLENN